MQAFLYTAGPVLVAGCLVALGALIMFDLVRRAKAKK